MATAPTLEELKNAVMFAFGARFFEGVTRVVDVAPIASRTPQVVVGSLYERGTAVHGTVELPQQSPGVRLQFFFGDELAFDVAITRSVCCSKCSRAISRGEAMLIANALFYCGRCAP